MLPFMAVYEAGIRTLESDSTTEVAKMRVIHEVYIHMMSQVLCHNNSCQDCFIHLYDKDLALFKVIQKSVG